ncbi:endonuclease/exonuclease/phosphatase family protein [Luedemannella helvata]|uniref:Endonuclease/exonuclease/phosphatase domain-containing protein n=1 Tax=Luedemannella helvata TaxID=349315 RepID=A0ABP4VYU1_9ACTN
MNVSVALRVMTYNLLRGGRPDRLPAIMSVITDARPDVLALQELGAMTARRFAGFGADLGMRGRMSTSWFGQPVGILVRDAVTIRHGGRVRRPFHHGAPVLTIDTSLGPLTVLAAHLHPLSGRRRLREARWLAAYAGRRRPALLLGDLNSLDPWDDHARRLADLRHRYRGRHLRRDGTVDTRAIAALVGAGFVDVFRRTGSVGRPYTAPTEGPWGAEFSRMRLDYVLATEELAARARTCHTLDTNASDHYPVVADFDVEPGPG